MEFFLQPKEEEALRGFLNAHGEDSIVVGEVDRSNISLQFTQTGIGVATVVRCKACGVEKNITDFSTW